MRDSRMRPFAPKCWPRLSPDIETKGESLDKETENEVGAEGEVRECTPTCPNCGSRRQWESLIDDAGEERWLTICPCGHMEAFLPDQPHVQAKDPLRAYLLGPGRDIFPAAPPWIRLFLSTIKEPRPIRWSYVWQKCPSCGTAVRMGMQAYPRGVVLGLCSLCLSCGYVTASYSIPKRLTDSVMSGAEWTPPCPAVQRLRDCALRSRMVLFADGWGSPSTGEWTDWIPE